MGWHELIFYIFQGYQQVDSFEKKKMDFFLLFYLQRQRKFKGV